MTEDWPGPWCVWTGSETECVGVREPKVEHDREVG